MQWLNASPATVRRDIAWLAERDLLLRTRGGAHSLPEKKPDFTGPGLYLMPLHERRELGVNVFEVAEIPPSPGYFPTDESGRAASA